MPSDYATITRYNEEQLGKDTASRKSQVNMYSDFSHFVFEILQNADDYKATTITFNLTPEKLVIEHNGVPFTEENVKAISYFGKGTSREDLIKTGHFGLGFKAVFAFTATPAIHSGEENFRVYDLYRLEALPCPTDFEAKKTRICLPFNHMEERPDFVEPLITKEEAFDRISCRLKKLDITTLLFTRNVLEIKWIIQDEKGHYLRWDKDKEITSEYLRIRKTEITDGDLLHTYLIFCRPIKWKGKDYKPVEIAFFLGDSNDIEQIHSTKKPLYVLFPTTKETYMGFLINAPFRTPPHRETVSQEDGFNEFLIKEIANLICDALPQIKEKGLLSVDFLETLPIRMSDFPKGSMFYPIVEAVRDALLDQELLPTDDGTFVSARNAKLTRSSKLRKLLTQNQLRELFQSNNDIKWLSGEITQDLTPDLRSYLMSELDVEEITPDGFARRISSTFLASQTDDWFIAFYKYLSGQEALWRSPRWDGDSGGLLRRKPILRLQDNKQEVPFRSDGKANAYLPPPEETDFPIVKREIVDDEQVAEFLRRLDLSEPDVFDDIVERVLPKYNRQDVSSITPREHAMDIQKVLRAMASDSDVGKKKVLQAAKNTPFLKAVDYNGNSSFKKPDDIYFPDENLKNYFSGCPDIWFLDETTGDKEWEAFGIENKPRFKKFSIDLPEEEKSRLRGDSGHTEDIEITDYDLDGLENFLKSFEGENCQFAEHSLILWNYLLAHFKEGYHYSFYEGEYKWRYYVEKTAQFDARWKKRIVSHAWLPKAGGICPHNPPDLSPEELPESFIRDEKLADLLRMKKDEIKKIEEKTGGKFIPREEYAEYTKWKEQKAETEKVKGSTEAETDPDKIDYKDELEKSFNRPGETELQDQITDDGKVRNPDYRRAKSYEGHKERLHGEPRYNERRKETIRTILEGPDEQVREYLFQLYAGKCQICGKTFPDRNGNPFFIANYIVPKKHARFVDTPANALCLCADHFAKLQHGAIETENILEQIEHFKTESEGGNNKPELKIKLCGEECVIKYEEKHLLDLQELIRASENHGKEITNGG